MKSENTKKDIYEIVTDTIIEKLEKELEGEFRTPWISPGLKLGRNATSKKNYQATNQLIISNICIENEYYINDWLTFKQAAALGGKIKKGEKGAAISFVKKFWKDKDGEISYTKNDDAAQERKFLKKYFVWNVSQIENLPSEFYLKNDIEIDTSFEDMKSFCDYLGINLKLNDSASAYCFPEFDEINLPKPTYFKDKEAFFSIFFHELVHWTGGSKQLNREMVNKDDYFDKYAFEELVAEIGANFLCAHFGKTYCSNNSIFYIKNWLGELKNDNRYIFRAASAAQKAFNFLIDQYNFKYMAA